MLKGGDIKRRRRADDKIAKVKKSRLTEKRVSIFQPIDQRTDAPATCSSILNQEISFSLSLSSSLSVSSLHIIFIYFVLVQLKMRIGFILTYAYYNLDYLTTFFIQDFD